MKNSTVFVCQECGYESPKWMGQCVCGAWNSFIEEKISSEKRSRSMQGNAVKLSDVESAQKTRIDTGIGEFNRVLGGGVVAGSLVLIAGEPGIGKSTLILQAAMNIKGSVLYVSGEESEEQIKIRGDRIRKELPDNLYLMSETNLEHIIETVDRIRPQLLIIDSIQTTYTDALDSAAGSVSQVRSCGHELMKLGKMKGIPIFIVAHVTKSGDLAGPKIIEHLVDCVLQFTGERNQDLRILRSNKNRFGTTSEIGAFDMGEGGLIEIENLSRNLLDDINTSATGSAISAIYEGTRPLIMEIQALTAPANVGFARRSSIGVELARLNMIIAVLERKAGLSLIDKDVYVNIVGGLRPDAISFDLAVALAICSSAKEIPLSNEALFVGEVGLTGDFRSVQHADKIAKEAERLGFKKLVLPKKNADKLKSKISLIGVSNITEAVEKLSQRVFTSQE